MPRNPETRNQARDRERSQRYGVLLPGKGGKPPEEWRRHGQDREARDAKDRLATERTLEGCSPANQIAFRAFVSHKGRRTRVNQLRKYATTLAEVDRFTHGTPWGEWSPDQLRAWTDGMLARVKPSTSAQYALMPWAFLRHQYGLQDRNPPNATKLALEVSPGDDENKPKRIADEHFLALLGRHKADLMYQALLWVLWDSGFRIGEALSLNVGSVRFADDGVYLTLPPRTQARFRLKHRSREVWVDQCVTALRNWLSAHPFPGRRDAPLFLVRLNQNDNAPWIPFGPDRAQRTIRRTWTELDLPPIRDHDFRHNRAFLLKKAGMTAEKMRVFFGWSDGSAKPDEYGRLVAADLRDDVRRASASNRLGQVVVSHDGEAEAKLRALRDVLGRVLDHA